MTSEAAVADDNDEFISLLDAPCPSSQAIQPFLLRARAGDPIMKKALITPIKDQNNTTPLMLAAQNINDAKLLCDVLEEVCKHIPVEEALINQHDSKEGKTVLFFLMSNLCLCVELISAFFEKVDELVQLSSRRSQEDATSGSCSSSSLSSATSHFLISMFNKRRRDGETPFMRLMKNTMLTPELVVFAFETVESSYLNCARETTHFSNDEKIEPSIQQYLSRRDKGEHNVLFHLCEHGRHHVLADLLFVTIEKLKSNFFINTTSSDGANHQSNINHQHKNDFQDLFFKNSGAKTSGTDGSRIQGSKKRTFFETCLHVLLKRSDQSYLPLEVVKVLLDGFCAAGAVREGLHAVTKLHQDAVCLAYARTSPRIELLMTIIAYYRDENHLNERITEYTLRTMMNMMEGSTSSKDKTEKQNQVIAFYAQDKNRVAMSKKFYFDRFGCYPPTTEYREKESIETQTKVDEGSSCAVQ